MGQQLEEILNTHKRRREELIPILQEVQQEFSYLPDDTMLQIARFLGVPESRVYGVATFYAQFRFTPKGETHIMVCRGTACHVSGASRILEQIEEELGIREGETSPDLEYSLETVACIGACSLAPCVTINERVEAKLTPDRARALLRKGGKP
jgi:NADH-quinone oxidoreductase subunit E